MSKPLQLISFDAEGKFVVGFEALALLQKLRGPVGVLAVCGRARQGKSFILNRIAQTGSGEGFEVGPTHRPCTKGLWMWSEPIPQTTPDGRKYHMILLDTEGIDAYDQTGQYSVQIFSLALLLSSMFIYNQMGGIDEAALDRLSLVTEMSKHIRVRASQKNGNGELGVFSPHFLWLLRDFYLDLSEEGRQITPKEYLEISLRNTAGTSQAALNKNSIRDSIRELFPQRDCFSLVRPMHDERQLQHMATLDPQQLRPEFAAGVDDLMQYIFLQACPKVVGSVEMNGPLLAGLAETYVKALNNGAVPSISSAWQGVAETECQRALDDAERAYVEGFNESVGADEAVLTAEHTRCLGLASTTFHATAIGAIETRRAYEDKLKATLHKRFDKHKARMFAEAAAGNMELLEAAGNRMRQTAGMHPPPRIEDLAEALVAEAVHFEQISQGPNKHEKLLGFVTNCGLPLMVDCARQAERGFAAEREDLERRLHAARSEAEAANAEACAPTLRHPRGQGPPSRQGGCPFVQAHNAARCAEEARMREATARQDTELARKEAEQVQREMEQVQTKAGDMRAQAMSEVAEMQAAVAAANAEAAEARQQAMQAEAMGQRAAQDALHAQQAASVSDSRAAASDARALETERQVQEQQSQMTVKEAELNTEQNRAALLKRQLEDVQRELQQGRTGLASSDRRRREEAERAAAAEASAARWEAAEKALQAEVAREKAASTAATGREASLRRQLEGALASGRANGAAYDNCLKQWEVEAKAASAHVHGRTDYAFRATEFSNRENMRENPHIPVSKSGGYSPSKKPMQELSSAANDVAASLNERHGHSYHSKDAALPAAQLTSAQLKERLVGAGYGNEVLKCQRKKDLVELYERRYPQSLR
ncbi:hypothetical protein CYMTET_45332 [Cymbomonas tetramitiformis]|uniref:GB1/RHD3-type G domain-containing protein n=1 Tax=Cymbomonas tetramitiformis TaxID=36881 RepID=A0AAE0BYE4_9CHLO|nr:hypothetical protein CYMTET_45332 [Cymbomonas tetramitiformis]